MVIPRRATIRAAAERGGNNQPGRFIWQLVGVLET